MRLLRLNDVESRSTDRVFRYSRIHAVLLVLAALGVAGWFAYHAYAHASKPCYYIAGAIVLFVELMRRFVGARFRPSNWLVRMNDEGVLIQFRSYLNYHLPPEDLTVVFLSYGEIRSARLIKERVTVPDPQDRGSETQFIRYVELELAGDVAPLAQALEAEASENAPKEKRWYGRSSTLYQDHPVRMESPPFLRIRWQAVPGTHKFLDALRPYTIVADTVSLTQDLANLQGPRPEQEKRLRELALRGETISAIYTACKLYGGSLAEAKDLVDGLAKSSQDSQQSKSARQND
jgi:hypothetical protein